MGSRVGPSKLFGRASVSSRFFQGGLHFFDCDDGRVIIDRVDLFKTAKAFFDFLNTIQPFQGCLTDVISPHEKDRRCFLRTAGLRYAMTGKCDNNNDYSGSQNGQDA